MDADRNRRCGVNRVRKSGSPPLVVVAVLGLWVCGAALAENVDPASEIGHYVNVDYAAQSTRMEPS